MNSNFTIGISTKNRWSDLRFALDRIKEFGWSQVPILIYDDFSDEPCPFDVRDILPNAIVKRFPDSQGYIKRRNELALNISTRYYLSLDDDSYPVQGDIHAAIEFIDDNEDVFCIAFPIFNPIYKEFQVASLKNDPYQVRSFIGCAHLLDIEKFNQLGGYREELIHQGEELDIAIRAYMKNWKCYHFPGFQIDHRMSLEGRNWHRMDYYGARNNILWNSWYLPPVLIGPVQFINIISRILLSIRVCRRGQIDGIVDAFKLAKNFEKFRMRLPLSSYRRWHDLPNS